MNLSRFTRLWNARPTRKARPARVRPELEALETRITPQATRTWVSGVGDDANPCSRTAPGKTFAGAISKTEVGGEIDALDPGGFGALTITHAITIDGAGQLAGVLVSGTNGFTIAAAATDVVILRGLNFDGASQTGLDGIHITGAKTVIIENCTIENFHGVGIDFLPSTPNSQLIVSNTTIRGCVGGGIQVIPQGGMTATASLTNVRSEANQFGLLAGNNATVTVSNSVAAGNLNYGFLAAPTATAPVQLTLQNDLAADNGMNGIASVGLNTVVNLANVSAYGNGGTGAASVSGGSLVSQGGNHITDNNKNFTPAAITLSGGGGATRTWVSGVGDDANPASRTAPAKTFAGAISKTTAGGEINVTDPGGFGALTITKAITIDGTGTFAAVLVAGTPGIVVSAGANDIVILRNLTINGIGSGTAGIQVNGAAAVLIENCVIENFTGAGIDFKPTNTDARLIVTNTRIENCGGAGIDAHPTATGSGLVLIDGVQSIANQVGFKAEDRADVTVLNSDASSNSSHGLQVVAATAAATLNVEGGVTMTNGGNGLQAQGTGSVGATANIANLGASGNALPAFGAANPANSFLSFIGPNQQFVEALYLDFLKRSGDATNASDAGVWANALTNGTMTQAQVTTSIARSAEALGVLVDGLYLEFLNRASDPMGRAGFVSQLQNGGTVEQAIASMVGTTEYMNLFSSSTSFVQSLYTKLLGRAPSAGELSSSLNSLMSLGRSGLASAFLASGEFRGDVVQELYGSTLAPVGSVVRLLPSLLHRTMPPAAAEVNGWVNSGLDVLSIEVALAGTAEFFNDA